MEGESLGEEGGLRMGIQGTRIDKSMSSVVVGVVSFGIMNPDQSY